MVLTHFFDAHLHSPHREAGAFLVGLEGNPVFDGTLNNAEVLALHAPQKNYWAFEYVVAGDLHKKGHHPLLKYHPRRETYSPEQVIESIRLRAPVCVMLDTLNEPAWQAYEYWKIARAFPDVPFIFAHAGGYLIQEFIKICHFQPNVWIDFALTHTNFGGISSNPLAYVDDAIRYALHAPFRDRVLMGSDAPFFSQADVVAYYAKLGAVEMLNTNFERLLHVF